MKENNAVPLFACAFMLLGVVLIGAPLLLGHKPLQPAQPPAVQSSDWSKVGTGSSSSKPPAGGDAAQLVTTNNTAVKLMQAGKIQEAIDLLEPEVKRFPQYSLGRDNLAIAYNNLALKQTETPKLAIDSLWRSMCLSAKEAKTTENIEGMLKYMHKDAKKFEDRVAMGDAQMAEGCLYGAYAEYTAALKIHADDKVSAKLTQLQKQAKLSGDDDVNGAFFVKIATAGTAKEGALQATDDVDYGPYMARLQREIKKKWYPPKRNGSKRTQVTFCVAKDGTISNSRISKSSGDEEEDKAGLDAVKTMGKADPLPPGASPSVDVQFTFDYNVFGGSKNN